MIRKYDHKSEKVISEILINNKWADKIYWDRNDWYIEWTKKGEKILNRLPSILNYSYNLDESDKTCIEFMKEYFGLSSYKNKFDDITVNMQEMIIGISQNRLNRTLSNETQDRIRENPRTFIGLEIIIDTVSTIELSELEDYLNKI